MATSIFKENFPQVKQLQQKAEQADYIIGMDLHKKTIGICVVDSRRPTKPIFQRKRLKNEKLIETLDQFEGKKLLVVEAAFGWFPLRETVKDLSCTELVLVDARKTAAWVKASGVKNDKIDSEVLCMVALQRAIPRLAVHQPESSDRERFKLIHSRDKLVSERTRIKNQITSLNRDYEPNPYTGEIPEQSEDAQLMSNLLLDQLNELNTHIKKLEQRMETIAKEDSLIQLLQSIPAIGLLTAFALRFKIGSLERFEGPKQLCSYFGFAIKQWDSGDGKRHGRITKCGNSLVRKLLVQGGQHLRFKRPEIIQLYFPNLAEKELMKFTKHANKVIVAVARKHLTFVYQCWKKQEAFDLQLYTQNRQKSLSHYESSTRTIPTSC
jgi:transposase